MNYKSFILLLSSWLLISSASVAQVSNESIEGIYYGFASKGYSQFKKPIVIRYYKDGLVLLQVLKKEATNLDLLVKSFSRKNKSQFGNSMYQLNGDNVEFYSLYEGETVLCSGTFKIKGDDIIHQLTAENKKKQIYHIKTQRVWPEKKVLAQIPDEKEVIAKNQEEITTKEKLQQELETELTEDVTINIENGENQLAISSLNNKGAVYFDQGNFEGALKSFEEAMMLASFEKDSAKTASLYLNIGASYEQMGQTKTAVSNYNKAKGLFKKLGNKLKEAMVIQRISEAYKSVKDIKSERVQLLELESLEKQGSQKEELAATLNNLGVNYYADKNLDVAEEKLLEGIKLLESFDKEKLLATLYNNLGNVYFSKENYDRSLIQYQKSLKIKSIHSNYGNTALTTYNIGNAHMKMNHLDSASYYFETCLDLAEQSNDNQVISATYLALSELKSNGGTCKEPIDYFKQYATHRFAINFLDEVKQLSEYAPKYVTGTANQNESLTAEVLELKKTSSANLLVIHNLEENIRKQDLMSKLELKSQKDEINLLAKDKEILAEQHQTEKESSKKKTYLLIGATLAGLLAIALLIVTLKSKNKHKKDKEEIGAQKEKIEQQHLSLSEHHREIQESITYAKRLQLALLPTIKQIKEHLQDSFVLYQPKDIVAGDFYWMEVLETPSQKTILFAAADCTGHGVPGAMVSVVCNNGLNRSVREFGLKKPGEILDKTREIVIKEFEKSVDEVKDGMDIALCSLQGNTLHYAGANNPLWLIKRGGQEVIQIKADKQPIGQFERSVNFATHSLEVEKGDTIYLFSDGFADQFGGEKGKKYKTANFKRLLLKIQDKSMAEQQKIIHNTFEKWRGDLEQIDDVCVIGVRV